MAINDEQNEKKHSLAHMGNMSFDEELQISATELLGYDGTAIAGSELKRVSVDPDGKLNVNASVSMEGAATEETAAAIKDQIDKLSFSANGELETTSKDETVLMGDIGPISQWEREQSNYDQLAPIMTYDIASEKVFGTQRLTNAVTGKLQVETNITPDQVVNGIVNAANKEVIIALNGHQTVSVQLSGTWAGTISFTATANFTSWVTMLGTNPAATTTQVSSTTANGITIFSVAGMKALRVQFTAYTSGVSYVTLVASYAMTMPKAQVTAAQGSQTQSLQQKATSFELIEYDNSTSTVANALTPLQQWNPSCTTYIAGDWVMYNNQIYQCIAAPGSTVANMVPTNTTYWTLDRRQNRNLVTNSYLSSPDAQRLRVEIDMDGYQYRLAEMTMLDQKVSNWIALAANEGYESQGYASMGNYMYEEVR